MISNITENHIFRKFTCGLTKIQTAHLCFKSVRTVTRWDAGQEIPPECRRLMRMYSGRELAPLSDNWKNWRVGKGVIITPNNWSLTPDRILTGNALLEIGSEQDLKTATVIMQTARLIKNLPTNRRS